MPSWFRVDAHIARSADISRLSSDAVRWTWICVLAEGKLAVRQGCWHDLRHLSACLPGRPLKHLRELLAVGLLEQVDAGQVCVHNWDRWQSACPSDPTTATRSRRYRDAHRDGTRNGTATASRHGQTETETETEIKAGPPTPRETPSERLPACPPGSPPARRASAARKAPQITPEQEQAIDHERRKVHRKYPRDHLEIDRVLRDALYADCHPNAIVQGLQRLAEYQADRPAAYIAKILRVESGNHHEADAIAQGDAWKQAGSGLTDLIRMARRAAEGGDGADPVG